MTAGWSARSTWSNYPFLDDRGRSAVVLSELVASLFGQTVLDRPARLKPWRS